jgi:hypothetical protein
MTAKFDWHTPTLIELPGLVADCARQIAESQIDRILVQPVDDPELDPVAGAWKQTRAYLRDGSQDRRVRLKDGTVKRVPAIRGGTVQHWLFPGTVGRWGFREMWGGFIGPDGWLNVAVHRRFVSNKHRWGGVIRELMPKLQPREAAPKQKPGPKPLFDTTLLPRERKAKERAKKRGIIFDIAEYRRKRR